MTNTIATPTTVDAVELGTGFLQVVPYARPSNLVQLHLTGTDFVLPDRSAEGWFGALLARSPDTPVSPFDCGMYGKRALLGHGRLFFEVTPAQVWAFGLRPGDGPQRASLQVTPVLNQLVTVEFVPTGAW